MAEGFRPRPDIPLTDTEEGFPASAAKAVEKAVKEGDRRQKEEEARMKREQVPQR